MSTSETIRQYSANHPVFGSQEIREQYGDKPALLVTRLAAKGMFTRIKNGVFARPGYEQDENAYRDYLERRHCAMLERAEQPAASLADRYLAWASSRISFSEKEANDHFGTDMRGWLQTYMRSGKILRHGYADYRYEGYHPAPKRTNKPLAKPGNKHEQHVIDAISGHVVTARQIGEKTALSPQTVTAILNRLVQDATISCSKPTSKNQPRFYCIRETLPPPSDDALTLLAMIAPAGPTTTAQTAHFGIKTPGDTIQYLLALDMLVPIAPQSENHSTQYACTDHGRKTLDALGYGYTDLNPNLHRPRFRLLLQIVHRLSDPTLPNITHEFDASQNPINTHIALMEAQIYLAIHRDGRGIGSNYSLTSAGRRAIGIHPSSA